MRSVVPADQLPVGFGQIRPPTQLPVLTMVTGYSRWLSAQLIPSRAAPDLFAGWWQLIERLGAVPRTLVWDGEGAIGRWRAGKTELTGECQAFRGTLGAKVIVLRPAEPEHKGIIERAHDYLERSFLPGRSFTGPDDFNTQLQDWLVDGRTPAPRRVLGCAPTERIAADRPAMLPLPPVAAGDRVAGLHPAGARPLRADRLQRLLDPSGRDRPPDRAGRRPAPRQGVSATAGWSPTTSGSGPGIRPSPIPTTVAAAKLLRRERVGAASGQRRTRGRQRCLADYDTAFGLDG